MRVVREAADELDALADQYVSKASAYMTTVINQVGRVCDLLCKCAMSLIACGTGQAFQTTAWLRAHSLIAPCTSGCNALQRRTPQPGGG